LLKKYRVYENSKNYFTCKVLGVNMVTSHHKSIPRVIKMQNFLVMVAVGALTEIIKDKFKD